MSNSLLKQKKSNVYNTKTIFDIFSKDEKEIAKDKISKTFHGTWEHRSSSSESSLESSSSTEYSSTESSSTETSTKGNKQIEIKEESEKDLNTILITKEGKPDLVEFMESKFNQIENMFHTLLLNFNTKPEKTEMNHSYIPYIGTKWNIDPKNKTWVYPPHLYSVIYIPNINQKIVTLFESDIKYKTNSIESGVFETADGVLGTVLGDFCSIDEGIYGFHIKEWIKGGSSYHIEKENFPICIHIQIILKTRKIDTENKKLFV